MHLRVVVQNWKGVVGGGGTIADLDCGDCTMGMRLFRMPNLLRLSPASTIAHLQRDVNQSVHRFKTTIATSTISHHNHQPMRRSSQSAFVTAVGRAAWYRNSTSTACRTTTSYVAPVLLRPCRTTQFIPRRHQSLVSSPIAYDQDVSREPYRTRIIALASAKTQQETEWNSVLVVSVETACEGHTLLTINVGTTLSVGSLTDSYRVPGMFVQLRPRDSEAKGIKPSYFAISSPPTTSGIFEFLIKDGDSTAWINKLSEDEVIESSPIIGKGFQIAQMIPSPKDVILFATGSGIAPIRAAIESTINGVDVPKRRSVTLLYGARTPERMAYSDRFDKWTEIGVKVIPVISRPQDTTSWNGNTGYVQHILKEMGVQDPRNTAFILCGVKQMAIDVKSLLEDMGEIPEKNVLLNF